jgi:hypothetical protein
MLCMLPGHEHTVCFVHTWHVVMIIVSIANFGFLPQSCMHRLFFVHILRSNFSMIFCKYYEFVVCIIYWCILKCWNIFSCKIILRWCCLHTKKMLHVWVYYCDDQTPQISMVYHGQWRSTAYVEILLHECVRSVAWFLMSFFTYSKLRILQNICTYLTCKEEECCKGVHTHIKKSVCGTFYVKSYLYFDRSAKVVCCLPYGTIYA